MTGRADQEKAARRAAADAFGESGLQAALDAYRDTLAAPYVPPVLPPEPPDGTVLAWEVPAGWDDDGEPTGGRVCVARRADNCATGMWGAGPDHAKTVSRWLTTAGDGLMSWEKLCGHGAATARRMVELPGPDDEAAVELLVASFRQAVADMHAKGPAGECHTGYAVLARYALRALAGPA